VLNCSLAPDVVKVEKDAPLVVLLQITNGERKEENCDRINRIREKRGIATKRHEKKDPYNPGILLPVFNP
jgi:hypothetical protein